MFLKLWYFTSILMVLLASELGGKISVSHNKCKNGLSAVHNLFGSRDQFRVRQFFHWPGGWFRDDSSELHSLCILFLLLLHQLHFRSSGIRPQRLGTLAADNSMISNSDASPVLYCSSRSCFILQESFVLPTGTVLGHQVQNNFPASSNLGLLPTTFKSFLTEPLKSPDS